MPAEADIKENVVFDAVEVEYRNMAPWYDGFWRSYTDATLRRPLAEALEAMRRGGRGGLRLVDVGCGTGEFLRRLRDALPKFADGDGECDEDASPPELIGVEPSEEMLRQARSKFDDGDDDEGEGEGAARVVLERSPAERLPLDDGIANVVASTSAFHFFRDKHRSLREMRRILRDGGALVITDWCADYWIVRLYHLAERLRWDWRFEDRYPSPLSGSELVGLVRGAGLVDVEHATYRVRVFGIFFWGMQTVKAKKR